MDLLRLAYGSVQDATPVSTPEASEAIEPQVESEASLTTPGNLPAAIHVEELPPSGAIGKNSDGEFLEEFTSNEQIPASDSPVDSTHVCSEQTLPGDLEHPLQKLNSHPDNPLASLNEQLIGDDSLSSNSNLTPQLDNENLDIPSVQIPQTQVLASAKLDHHFSEEKPGQVHENQLVPQPEVQDSSKKVVETDSADKKTEVAQSNDAEVRSSNTDMGSLRHPGSESGSLEEHPKADETRVPGVVDSGGKSLADAGVSFPSVEIGPELLTHVSEEDSLLLHVMKLKGTEMSSSRKIQNANCHSDSVMAIAKEGRESSTEATVAGKQVAENITSQLSGTDPYGTAFTEESLLLKVRQFKLRSGRLKDSVKHPEQVAPANTEPASRLLDLSGMGRRDGSAIEVFSTRRSRLKLSKNCSHGEDQAKEKDVQDSAFVQRASKANGVDVEEGIMQDSRDDKDSQPERSEVTSPADESIDKSPMSKRIKIEAKLLPNMVPLLECLRSISAHRFAPLFKQRQESQDNDRYNRLIKRHMDLNTVSSLLEEGTYSGFLEFFRDLLLVFNNALVFYSRDSQEFGAARILRECVMKEMEKLFQTEAPPKAAVRPTRKRELKKLGEVVNFISAVPASEGKRRGSLRSSAIDHGVYESIVDGELGPRGAALGLGPPSNLSRDSEVETSSQVKEVEMEEKEQRVKNFSKGSRRAKRAKVQINVDGKIDQFPAKKHKDCKEKNEKMLEDMGTKLPVKNDPVSNHGLKKSSPNFVKSKETSTKEPDISRNSKCLSGRHATVHQGEARNSSGGRASRNTQSTPPVMNSATRSVQVQKRGRT